MNRRSGTGRRVGARLSIMLAGGLAAAVAAHAETNNELFVWEDVTLTVTADAQLDWWLYEGTHPVWACQPDAAKYATVVGLCKADTPYYIHVPQFMGAFGAHTECHTGIGYVSLSAQAVRARQTLVADLSRLSTNEYSLAALSWCAREFRGPRDYPREPASVDEAATMMDLGQVVTVEQSAGPTNWMEWPEWSQWLAQLKRDKKYDEVGVWHQWPAPKVWGRALADELRPALPAPDPERADRNDPVNVIDGCVSVDETDIDIDAPGVALRLTRAYRSALDATGTLGPRWTHSYNVNLSARTTVFRGETHTWKVLLSESGTRYWFRVRDEAAGVYGAPVGTCWQLCRAPDGGYRLTIQPDRVYAFDADGRLLAVRDVMGRGVTLAYEAGPDGPRVARVTHDNGLGLDFSYDASGRFSGADCGLGIAMRYAYNAVGELVEATRIADGVASATRYLYDAGTNGFNHSMTQRVNRAGNAVNYAYEPDATGGVTSRAIHTELAPDDMRLDVARGRSAAVVRYDRDGELLTELVRYDPDLMCVNGVYPVSEDDLTQPLNYRGPSLNINFTSSAPGMDGVPAAYFTSVTRQTGTTFSRNAHGDLVAVRDYDADTGKWVTDTYHYDSRHNIVSQGRGYCSTPPFSGAYFGRGDAAQAPPADNSVAEYMYALGESVPAALGIWQYRWDDADNTLISMTDPEGVTVTIDYTNALPRAVHVHDGTNRTFDTTFEYENGLLTRIVNANGHWVRYTYDALGRPASTRTQGGRTIEYGHNALGYVEELRLPGADGATRSIRLENDALGRPCRVDYPDGTSEHFEHDVLGQLTRYTDRARRLTTYAYSRAGHQTTTTRYLGGRTPHPIATRTIYDSQSNPVAVRNGRGAAVETCVLDRLNRPVEVVNVESQRMHIAYAVSSYVDHLKRFDGTTARFDYDERGDLAMAVYPDATNRYACYMNGELMTASNAEGVVSNRYDGAGRLAATDGPAAGVSVSYEYLPAGNLAASSSPAGTSRYTYDEDERLTRLESPAGTFTCAYDPVSGELAYCLCTNTGLTVAYAYDMLDRMTAVVWRDATGAVLRACNYTYDDADRVVSVTRESGASSTYAYDTLDRLTGETARDAAGKTSDSAVLTYDDAGNRTSVTRGTSLTTYVLPYGTEGNRLASWSTGPAPRDETPPPPTLFVFGTAPPRIVTRPTSTPSPLSPTRASAALATLQQGLYAYNAAGCVTNIKDAAGDELRLTWDGQYHLTYAAATGTVLEAYAYDALGRRTRCVTQGAATEFLYDGPHVIADRDANGNLVRSYTYGPGTDNLLAMTLHTAEGNRIYYTLKDRLGSVLALVDDHNRVVESYTYDAWGRVLEVRDANQTPVTNPDGKPASPLGNRYLWQGREYSWQTGLYYFRARWYDPNTGRWLSKDPIGIDGGLNQYVFCQNNPVNNTDPRGWDVYKINRKLGGDKAKSRYNPVTHSYYAVVHPDGSIDTYSWGNTYDNDGNGEWRRNRKNDLAAAREAIFKRDAWHRGDTGLDPYIEKAFQAIQESGVSRHRWRLWNNCKNEARRLLGLAKQMQEEARGK